MTEFVAVLVLPPAWMLVAWQVVWMLSYGMFLATFVALVVGFYLIPFERKSCHEFIIAHQGAIHGKTAAAYLGKRLAVYSVVPAIVIVVDTICVRYHILVPTWTALIAGVVASYTAMGRLSIPKPAPSESYTTERGCELITSQEAVARAERLRPAGDLGISWGILQAPSTYGLLAALAESPSAPLQCRRFSSVVTAES